MEDCIFCKIVKGEMNASKFWEDEKFIAFLDVKPINPGHTLLIQKKHEDYIFDLEDSEYSELLLKAKEVAKLLKSKLNTKKIGLIVEGFGVSHVHVHLIPINGPHELDPGRAHEVSPEELATIAQKLKA